MINLDQEERVDRMAKTLAKSQAYIQDNFVKRRNAQRSLWKHTQTHGSLTQNPRQLAKESLAYSLQPGELEAQSSKIQNQISQLKDKNFRHSVKELKKELEKVEKKVDSV